MSVSFLLFFLNDILSAHQNQTENDFNEENEYWVPEPERRIYKGERAKIKDFPFTASVHKFNSFQCAGSIIKAWDNLFYRENSTFLSARVGSDFFNIEGENVSVLEIYFHPDYMPKNLRNNIAILRLPRHLKFKKNKLEKIEIDTEEP